MVDTLLRPPRQRRGSSACRRSCGVAGGDYAVATLHRAGNVDDRGHPRRARLRGLEHAGRADAGALPGAPPHPRSASGTSGWRTSAPAVRLLDPAGLPRDDRPGRARGAGAHRLRRPAGGDDDPGRALPHGPPQHRVDRDRRRAAPTGSWRRRWRPSAPRSPRCDGSSAPLAPRPARPSGTAGAERIARSWRTHAWQAPALADEAGCPSDKSGCRVDLSRTPETRPRDL